jgi:hypothetical protein
LRCEIEVTVCRSRQMTKRQAKPYGERVKELMAEKSRLLSKAQAFADMGLEETARPVWFSAASYEERIAPLLDVIGRDAEAALHRVSAAACFAKSGEQSRAANLYRAALAGPLADAAKADVERKLSACLKQLHQAAIDSVA